MEFNLADRFESVVDRVPDATAMMAGDRRSSFARLDGCAHVGTPEDRWAATAATEEPDRWIR